MKTVHVFKAQPSSEPVQSVQILIEQEIPEFSKLSEQDSACDRVVLSLETALYDSLPGAVYDRLLGWMLQRKSTHFRVTHEAK